MYQNIYIQRVNKERLVHIWDDKIGYHVIPFKNYCYIKNSQGKYTTIYGDSVSKITSWTKYQWPNLFEADIPADTRMLVDLYSDSDEVSEGHREVFFDIETEHEEKYPDLEKADMEITSIAIYERTLDEYYVFILDRNNEEIEPFEENGVVVMPFLYEEDLLEAFLDKWQEMNPSIVSGWNIDYFDIPYLYRRIRRVLGISSANSLSPIGKVTWNKYRERYFIAGISCLDYIAVYKKFSYIQLHSYALDAVARHELKKGKIFYEGDLNKLFRDNIKKFIEYNLVDVQLVVELDNKLNYIELIRGICHKGHVPYEDIFFSSRWIEGAMLTFMKRKNLVAPNRNAENKDEDHEKFKGAYVKSPEAAKFRWIFDLDFTSLYPSIMTTLNISPETKVGKILNWNPHSWVKNSIKEFEVEIIGEKEKYYMTPEEVKTLMDDANLSVSAIGVLYKKEVKGLVPQILDEWFKDKNKFDKLSTEWEIKGDEEKAKYYEDRRTIAKVMLNSIYGVLGLPKFRFYDIDNAESVTMTGQLLLKFAEKMANHYYNQILDSDEDYCIYMDTDSLFLLASPLIEKLYPTIDMNDDQMSEKILEITSQVQSYLNSSFDLFSNRFLHSDKHYFDIKQEVIARTGIWTSKKRYALHIINKKGVPVDKIDVKGLDVIRSTFPLAFRAFMKGLLKDFLKDVPQKEIDEKVLEMKDKIPHLEVAIIATPTGVKNLKKYGKPEEEWNKAFSNWIKGAPAHVKAALSYNEMLRHLKLSKKFPDIKEGEKIRWVYLKPNLYGLDTLAFKGYDDPKKILDIIEIYIDRNRIFEKVLKKKLMDFYSALNWAFPTKGQKIIDKFFVV